MQQCGLISTFLMNSGVIGMRYCGFFHNDSRLRIIFSFRNAFIDTVYPFGLHNSMFLPTIHSQATDEQKARWLPRTETYEVIGTYAQTELGHGMSKLS